MTDTTKIPLLRTGWPKNKEWKYTYRLDRVTIGQVMAMVLSYATNHSIIWSIVHGLFSWAYVLYYALGYGR